MKKTALTLALVVLAVSALATLSAPAAVQASTTHFYGQQDNGQTVTVNLGDSIMLDLGDGYTWTVGQVNPPIPEKPVLKMLGWHNGNPSFGYFQTVGRGQAIISGVGIPDCAPLCKLPDKHYILTVIVQ